MWWGQKQSERSLKGLQIDLITSNLMLLRGEEEKWRTEEVTF